jgi:hypothetical protein
MLINRISKLGDIRMKGYLYLIMMILMINIVYACGVLPAGTDITVSGDPSQCDSCHAVVENVYESVLGKITDTVIGHRIICASSISTWWDTLWMSEDTFNINHPTGDDIETVRADIARERLSIELDALLYQERKDKLNTAVLSAWTLNVGIIKLIIELMKDIIYLIEVWFLIFFIWVVIPEIFFKIRDALLVRMTKR